MQSKVFSSLRRWSLGLTFLLAGNLEAAFEIRGEALTGLANGPITVARESLETRDNVAVATGRVREGKLALRVDAEPGLFTLQIGNHTLSFVAADGQTIRLKAAADGQAPQLEGGHDQELFAAYEVFRAESLARKVTPVREAIATSRARGDEAEAVRLTEKEVASYAEHRRELNDFTLSNLRGSAALYAASLRWDGDYRLEELAAVVADYSRQFPHQEIGRQMTERIARFRATALGALAPSLAGSSPAGSAMNLTDLRGRYVLVDFWASWCAPCRLENRNYAELYRRYHSAGFEILAISVDENAVAWKAAIAKDGAAWLHVSDLKGWGSPLAGAYNVSALPANYLLDREGRIIARDLRGEKLATRLASLLSSASQPPR